MTGHESRTSLPTTTLTKALHEADFAIYVIPLPMREQCEVIVGREVHDEPTEPQEERFWLRFTDHGSSNFKRKQFKTRRGLNRWLGMFLIKLDDGWLPGFASWEEVDEYEHIHAEYLKGDADNEN